MIRARKISDDSTSLEKDEENTSSERINSGGGHDGGTNNQHIVGITWAQGNESFYATQDTAHE